MSKRGNRPRRGLSEASLVELLETEFARGSRRFVEVGIGDDAAVLTAPPPGHRLLWTIDTSIESVHFRRKWASLPEIGERATHAAVSDIAAMGGRPMGILCSVVLPQGVSKREVRAIAKGQARAAEELGCRVVGGNLSKGPVLELTTTVLGHAETILGRGGARPGDALWLAGPVGLARAGMLLLERGSASSRAYGACIGAWRRPRARLSDGRALSSKATACIDLSDGLAVDAERLADASGVRVVIEAPRLEKLLPSSLRSAAASLGHDALDLALQGGEDYALLATGPSGKRPRCASLMGRIETGWGAWVERDGRTERLTGGFDHLRGKG